MALAMTPFSLTPVLDKFTRYFNSKRDKRGVYNTNLCVIIDANIVTITTLDHETVLVTPVEVLVKEVNKMAITNLGPIHDAMITVKDAVDRINQKRVPSRIFAGNPLSIISALLSGDIKRPIREQQENTHIKPNPIRLKV